MFKKIVALAVTSGLAAQALRLWIHREQSRQTAAGSTRPGPRPTPDVQRWEDEGGKPATPPGSAV